MGDTASALERHCTELTNPIKCTEHLGFGRVNVSVRWGCGRSGESASNSHAVFMASQADIVGRGDSSVGPARGRGQVHWGHSKFSVQMKAKVFVAQSCPTL